MRENIRDYLTLSGNHRINVLLRFIDKHNNIRYTELSNALKQAKPKKLGGGTLWHTLKDARIMKLVENGYGFHLTELGRRFLNNFSQEVNKEAYLNVPLYKRCYEELPNEKEHSKVRDWFLPHLIDFDKKLRGTVIRRYLEGIWGVTVKKLPRVNINHHKTLEAYPPSKSLPQMNKSITYFEFLKSHNLSEDKIAQILTIIDNIPEEKQESSLKLLCKQMKI